MKLIKASSLFELGRSMAQLEMLVERMAQREQEQRDAAGIAEYESWGEPTAAEQSPAKEKL